MKILGIGTWACTLCALCVLQGSASAQLMVQFGDDVVIDNRSPHDLDPAEHSILLDDYRPVSVPGLVVNDNVTTVTFYDTGGAAVTSTSSTVAAGATWILADGASFFDSDATLGAGVVRDLNNGTLEFPWAAAFISPMPLIFAPHGAANVVPSDESADGIVQRDKPWRTTVHLSGDYIKGDETGQRLPPGSLISHAEIELTGLVGAGGLSGERIDIGTVSGGLVENEPADIPFTPADHDQVMHLPPSLSEAIDALFADIRVTLGLSDGVSLPVSAHVQAVPIPEPATLGLCLIGGGLLAVYVARRGPA